MECSCCFDDCLFRGMTQCSEGHLFCSSCAKRTVEEAIGSRKTELKCIAAAMDSSSTGKNGMCGGEFMMAQLKAIVDKKTLNAYHVLVQEIEIRRALVDNRQDVTHGGDDDMQIIGGTYSEFVACPKCTYGAIMESRAEEDKTFRCMNPQCGEVTCRLC